MPEINKNPQPNTLSWDKLFAVAGRPESLIYLRDQVYVSLKTRGMLKENEGIIKELNAAVDNAMFQADHRGNAWVGKPELLKFNQTDFAGFQTYLASISANKLAETAIKLNYSLSDTSEFLRGYESNGAPLEETDLNAMDLLFNAWLAENKMISKDGVIYVGNDKGEIQIKNKEEVRASPATLQTMLNAKNGGFEAYVQKNKPDVTITIQQFAAQKPQKEVQQANN